jgi:hypothetical protein
MIKTYHGSCHCGAVAFEIITEFSHFTKCNCTLCVKKNAVMTKVRESQFRILAGAEVLGTYQWNMGIARHHFCQTCGIYTFHYKRADSQTMGINVYCLNDADISKVPVIEVDGISMSLA